MLTYREDVIDTGEKRKGVNNSNEVWSLKFYYYYDRSGIKQFSNDTGRERCLRKQEIQMLQTVELRAKEETHVFSKTFVNRGDTWALTLVLRWKNSLF